MEMKFGANHGICKAMKALCFLAWLVLSHCIPVHGQVRVHRLSKVEYEYRVAGAWTGQIIATLMAFPFEHKASSAAWIDDYPKPYSAAPVDDDWYYEMVALRAFEHYGTELSLEQLAAHWKEHSVGTWGSSEQARLLLSQGVPASWVGHPRYNRLWYSIGPQFSCDMYGMIAPGMPNLAAGIARRLSHINGYAEGSDGGVFVAGMISLAFVEKDPRQIVRKAARLIHPSSPYRQCLDLVVSLAESGSTAREVFDAVEDRWHMEYPATNNAVANGGLVAASVWFGEGDFMKSVNLAAGAADFSDADCNAANAGAVAGAMSGLKGIPTHLVSALNDRIVGSQMGPLGVDPPVDESLSAFCRRVSDLGLRILARNGVQERGGVLSLTETPTRTQEAETFRLSELTRYWNPDWTLERAGFGGAGGGMRGIRGITYLEGDVLATYPRDEVRGTLLHRKLKMEGAQRLVFEVAADPKRHWELSVFADNDRLHTEVVKGGDSARVWKQVQVDLSAFDGREVTLRLYQKVLLPGREAGNAYWRNLGIQTRNASTPVPVAKGVGSKSLR
jgi:hypothetical protein